MKDIEDKIPNVTNSAPNTTLNAKINVVKNEILNITILATTVALEILFFWKISKIFFLILLFFLKKSFQGIFSSFKILIGSA